MIDFYKDGEYFGEFFLPKPSKKISGKLIIKNGKGRIELNNKLFDPEKEFLQNFTLRARFFSNSIILENITFFNCIQEFEQTTFSFTYLLYSKKTLKSPRQKTKGKYFNRDEKFKNISFSFQNMEKWLWGKHSIISQDFEVSFYDKSKNKIKSISDASHIEYTLPNIDYSYKIKMFKKETLSIRVSSFPFWDIEEYPEIKTFANPKIELTSNNPISFLDFQDILNIFLSFFTFVSGEQCLAKEINFSNKNTITTYFSNSLYPSEYNYSPNKTFYPKITFFEIKDNFEKIIKKWYSSYKIYGFIVSHCNEYNKSLYLDKYFIEQAQVLETFGNIISKGNYRGDDIAYIIEYLDESTFNKLFVERYCDGKFFFAKKSFKKRKEELVGQIRAIRNYFAHPFFNGKYKNPAGKYRKRQISKNFRNGKNLNLETINELSKKMDIIIRFVLLKELKLQDKFKKYELYQ
ncbi:MAG: hypothetical protein HOF38_01525 [Elusimicrobiaceae bacterium]|nr:hypothetical protein [Elusimicrobiaceae bacterium]MBT5987327.1 hypothetical protein [Elusimicrobiaceae bacterium]